MNERIQQLKESTRPEIDWEARHYVELNNGEKEKWMDEWFEKFAELLVAEFFKFCEHESNDDEHDEYDMGMWVKAESIKTAIKQHFGVE
jgi:hypothetical protein